jgi:hypothetical protein
LQTPDVSRLSSEASPESHPIQIASNSEDWSQFLNPVSSAEAAEARTRAARNGVTPNLRHSLGIARAIEIYSELGYLIERDRPTAVAIAGFATPRVYDFIAQDPISNEFIGVEVKTTFFDTIYLDRSQWTKT